MRIASLGSGSQGNGTLVEWSSGSLLLDCGFSAKEAQIRLRRLNKDPASITALVVTHEHADHIKGVGALARRFKLPVYMTPGTYHSRDFGNLPDLRLIESYQAFNLNDLHIEPVAVPHDACEPAQFIFTHNNLRLGILTDLGSISPHVEASFQSCHALVLEANHDPVMLASGPYPQSLKTRVGGQWGHLSNQQTAGFLMRVDTDKLRHLIIAHISQKNNTTALVQESLMPVSAQVKNVIFACQDEGFDWIDLTL